MDEINLLNKELEKFTESEIDINGLKMPFKSLYSIVITYYASKGLSIYDVVFKKIKSFSDGPPPSDQHWMLIGDDYFGVPEDFLSVVEKRILNAETKS